MISDGTTIGSSMSGKWLNFDRDTQKIQVVCQQVCYLGKISFIFVNKLIRF